MSARGDAGAPAAAVYDGAMTTARAAHLAAHFAAWDGGCAVLSRRPTAVVPTHAHYAIQIAFGPAPGIRFQAGEGAPWVDYAAAVIPSRQPHSMDTAAVAGSAVLFVEPETHEGRALGARWLQGGIAAVPDEVIAPLAAAVFDGLHAGDRAAVERAVRAVVRTLGGGAAPADATDERILRATAYVKAHLDRPLDLEEVAAEACLSPSRFRHLFVEETGMGLRPYILWRRFLRVWELLAAGYTISGAAHAAGFADAAHLTRTCRQMFGWSPSQMLALTRDA
jgi:AraC family transcriptional regulator